MENSKSSCELCSSPATTYCESDRARLCWHCDGKVHKANFLVSKHCRTLLCHLCNKPTPWTASGPMLPPSLSFCVACASTTSSSHAAAVMTPVQSAHLPLAHSHHDENDGEYESYDDDEDEDTDEDEDEDEDDEEEGYSRYTGDDVDEEDDDNQVVPLTTSSSVTSNNTITRGLNNVCCSSSNEAQGVDEDEDEDEDENEEEHEGDDGRISSMMLPSSLKRSSNGSTESSSEMWMQD